MNSGRKQVTNVGLSVDSVLGIVFIVLKLCGVIHWSWVWVLFPFWGGLALSVVIVLIAVIVLPIKSVYDKHKYRKARQELRDKISAFNRKDVSNESSKKCNPN